MATRLEQAWTEVSKLSPEEQDAFADWMVAELRSEKNRIDYSHSLKRYYPNCLLKHLKNIIMVKRRNAIWRKHSEKCSVIINTLLHNCYASFR